MYIQYAYQTVLSPHLKEGLRVSNGRSYLVHIFTSELNLGESGLVNLGVGQVRDGTFNSVIEVKSLVVFIGDRVGDVI
jgi:hypothetical protein